MIRTLGVLCALLVSSAATAGPVGFIFSGTADLSSYGLSANSQITGFVSWEATTPPGPGAGSNTYTFEEAGAKASLAIGGVPYTVVLAGSTFYIRDSFKPLEDGFTADMRLQGPISGLSRLQVVFHLPLDTFASIALPQTLDFISKATLRAGQFLGSQVVGFPLSATTLALAGGTWSLTGPMSTGRVYHAATLLADGRVLVSGGRSGSNSIASAEVYDSTLDAWSATGAMSISRQAHATVLLQDGRVLVSGGSNSAVLNSAELYDPSVGTWSLAGPMTLARAQHTATLLTDGRVLVSGGGLASAEIYDPALGTWSTTGAMSTVRSAHTATLLADGRVLVSGGSESGSPSAEIYDPVLGTWSAPITMNAVRFYHTATLLSDGRVLVNGGNYGAVVVASVEIFDPSVNTWSLTSGMSTARAEHTAMLLADGRVLVSGGYDQLDVLASAEVYDPSAGTWSATYPMSTTRYGHTATPLPDGRLLVSSGQHQSGDQLASAEIFSAPTADVTAPQVSCGTADSAWHNGDVTIVCTSSDAESGLAHASDASFTLTTSVASGTETATAATNSREVCNTVGVCSTAGPVLGNRVDKKAPAISCGAPDAAWHNSDVAVACTAADGGSGLAIGADASFNLTTNVAAGTETSSASTNSRQVCDAVGACSTAGAVNGMKVDKKPPTIAITSPTANAAYQLNAVVGSSYACGDGGAGTSSCQGPIATGSPINTSSTGNKTFTVTASDNVGNPSTLTVPYSVVSGGGGGATSVDVAIGLSAPSKIPPGGTLAYALTVTNGGNATATGIVVTDAVPAGTVFASASSSQGTRTTPAVGGTGTVVVNVGSLAKGATANINIIVTVTAAAGTVLSDTATVSATTQDLNNRNNSATQATTVKK